MEQDTKSIKAAITKNYLLSIAGGGGGVALLILLYLLKPFPDFGLKSPIYLSALTFLMAMWIAVWVIIMQTTVSLERLIKESQNVEQESEKILAVDGIILTRYNARRTLDTVIEKEVRCHYGRLVMNTRIRENSRLVQAALLNQDIFTYDPLSNGAIDYTALLEEMKFKLENI